MYKGRDLIGKTIVSYDQGEKFDTVKDLIFDQDTNQLLGFLVAEASWFSSAWVLLLEDVQGIGPDAIIAPSKNSLTRASEIPVLYEIIKHNNILKGTRILTMNGRDLGTIIDLYFNEKTGDVEGYEVSGGLFADAYSGRSFMPAPQTLKIGKDIAFVPIQIAQLMEEQVGGIKGAMQSASDKVQETAQLTGDKLQELGRITSDKVQETAQLTGDKLQELGQITSEKAHETAQITGDKLHEFRQIASEKAHETAQITGDKLHELGQIASEKAHETAQITGDKLHEFRQIASEKAHETAQLTGDKLQEFGRNATTSMTNVVIDPQEQKDFAIGKMVDHNIIAAGGQLLIVQGQIVTPMIASSAEYLGVLDELYRATGGNLSGKLGERFGNTVAGFTLDQAEGRRVRQVVRTDAGSIIAAPGQIVTKQVIEQAKTYHQEQALLEAVGLSTGESVRDSTSSAMMVAGDRIKSTTQSTGEQLQAGAQGLWTQAKATVIEIQDRGSQAIEDKRIKGALGRAVTRVILDQHDEVILNLGELITHQAIASARESQVLDLLLSSVYNEKPQLSLEDLRAPHGGKAAL